MTDVEIVTNTLEQCAELDVDLTPAIYDVFFETCAGAVPLMDHSDEHMRGRMAEQAFELIMDDSLEGAGNYLRWEVDNHLSAYSVDVSMYRSFFAAVKAAVKRTIINAWQDEHEQAWNARIEALLADIHSHAAQTSGASTETLPRS